MPATISLDRPLDDPNGVMSPAVSQKAKEKKKKRKRKTFQKPKGKGPKFDVKCMRKLRAPMAMSDLARGILRRL